MEPSECSASSVASAVMDAALDDDRRCRPTTALGEASAEVVVPEPAVSSRDPPVTTTSVVAESAVVAAHPR